MPSLNDLKDMSFQIYGLWNKRDTQSLCGYMPWYYRKDNPFFLVDEVKGRLLAAYNV